MKEMERTSGLQMWTRKFAFAAALAYSLLCAAGFGLIAAGIGERRIGSFDTTIIGSVQRFESDWMTRTMKAFSWLGWGVPVAGATVAAMLLLYFILGLRREILLMAAVAGASGLLNGALKLIFARERPDMYRLAEATGYSFPSGHSMAAFSLYGMIAYLLWKHVPGKVGRTLLLGAATALILAIGLSRIYLGVHFPSDVLGGFLASGCLLALAIWMYRRMSIAADR